MEFIVNTANTLSAEGQKHMDSKVFEYWLEALKTDQADTIQEILKGCTPSARDLLINGKFLYNKDGNHWLAFSVEACKSVIQGTMWFRPLVLLIASRAIKTLQLLLNDTHKETTDVFIRDDGDSNILHALILSSKCTTLEDEFICMYQYITNALDFETKKSLLMQENCAGLRPLELCVESAQLGLFLVHDSIFNNYLNFLTNFDILYSI